MRWTPASQIERSSLTHKNADVSWPGHSSRCAGPLKAAKPCETRASFGCESRAVPSVDWYETCRGKNSKAWKPPKPTNHHFFWGLKALWKGQGPFKKCIPLFFWVEGGKGEFRLCRFASGIWTSWTSAGNWPVSPILPACWLSGSRKTSLLGTCSIWSWQQQNRAKWQAESKLSLQSIQGRRLLLVNGVITTAKGRK